MPEALFESTSVFKQRFIDQLISLLDSDQLGVFILVLANASYREDIFTALGEQLKTHFNHWQQQLAQLKQRQNLLPVDDLKVFEQLVVTGFDQLKPTQRRQAKGWQLQFNPLRSYRPARNSREQFNGLYQPFNPRAFHFNKPFLKPEILWQGEHVDLDLRLLYNKFPFADYHGLMLLDPEREKPQFLSQTDCENVDRLLHALAHLEGMGLAYNSIGAYASVNHQHWQFFISEQDYPIEQARWTHAGGSEPYPLPVHVAASLQAHWPLLHQFQQQDQPFNLLLRADKVYLIARKPQGNYTHSRWSGGFAWSEVMGNVTVSGEDEYRQIDAADITAELLRLKP